MNDFTQEKFLEDEISKEQNIYSKFSEIAPSMQKFSESIKAPSTNPIVPVIEEHLFGDAKTKKIEISSNSVNTILEEVTPPSQQEPATKEVESIKKLDFYSTYTDKKGNREILINHSKLLAYLYSFGFRRFDIDKDNSIFVRIQDNVIEEISHNQIQDMFFDHIKKLPNEAFKDVSKSELIEKFYKGINVYFSKTLLFRLTIEEKICFVDDTKDKAFFYFKNGFVCVGANGLEFRNYDKLEGFIWKNQILDRNFTKKENSQDAVFNDFLIKIAKSDKETYISLCSIIGYILHSYKEGKRKAVNFTDCSISLGNEGRAGKTLLAKSLGKLRVYTEVNGKDFKPEKDTKYQNANLDTQILNLNDVTKKFTLESVYNDITEGIEVKKLYLQPFRILPKIIICSNNALRVESGSDKDRIIEFEFSNYFSVNHSPINEYGHLFFTDWNNEEWSLFDNLLLNCVSHYLKNGLIVPKNEFLNERKLLQFTSEEFLEFMNSYQIEFGKEYDKKQLFKDFLESYQDFDKMTQRTFNSWLKIFAKYKNEYSENIKEFRNTKDKNFYIVFYAESNHKEEKK